MKLLLYIAALLMITNLRGQTPNLEKMQAEAATGDAEAEYVLGKAYFTGQGVKANLGEARIWYLKAAEQGHVKAQNNLAVIFERSMTGPATLQEAVKWYRKAAEQGAALAQFNLGQMLKDGRGTPRDEKEAATWFRKAAEQGLPDAELLLGKTFYKGEGGLKQDYSEAFQWLSKAAAHDKIEAEYFLGVMRREGLGSEKDATAALVLFREAAEKGEPKSQGELGRAYANGAGVPEDVMQAYQWLKLSADQNEAHSLTELLKLTARMTPEQIGAGQKQVADFRARQQPQ